jgi:hypothetical protein
MPGEANFTGAFVVDEYKSAHTLETNLATGAWNSSRISAGQFAKT